MELTRRDALAAAVAPLLLAISGKGQGAQNAPVFVHDLPNLTMEDWQVTVSQITLPPGNVGAPHRHRDSSWLTCWRERLSRRSPGHPKRHTVPARCFTNIRAARMRSPRTPAKPSRLRSWHSFLQRKGSLSPAQPSRFCNVGRFAS